MKNLKDEEVIGVITVTIPIIKDLHKNDAGFPLNVGSLQLSLDGRNFVLDATETDYKNGKKAGKTIKFTSICEVDMDAFEEGEDYNYKLTVKDLQNKKLKVEFFCSDSDCATENAFDLDNAKVECCITVGEDNHYDVKATLDKG